MEVQIMEDLAPQERSFDSLRSLRIRILVGCSVRILQGLTPRPGEGKRGTLMTQSSPRGEEGTRRGGHPTRETKSESMVRSGYAGRVG
jgi:hypothetical protein